jgi:hypothetical protein
MASMRIKDFSPILFIFLASCAGSQLARPKIPDLLSTSSPLVLYTNEAFQKDYAAYKAAVIACSKPSALEECTAKQLRDSIINRIKLDIELNYREYASQLFLGRAGTNVGLDALELGLSTAATLAGAEGTKTILAGILTGGKGIRLSIDKNFFAERTTPIILGRMDILRESVANDLRSKMTLSVTEYPLEDAWNDLVELFYAGTLPAGIQALATDMGQAAGEMKAQRSLRLQKRMK